MNRYITLLTLSENFPDEESYIRYFEKMRWGDKVISPYDKLLRSSVVMENTSIRILKNLLMSRPELLCNTKYPMESVFML